MFTGDPRVDRVMDYVYDHPHAVFRWHSLTCVCESCLDADALFGGGNPPPYRYDTSGLSK